MAVKSGERSLWGRLKRLKGLFIILVIALLIYIFFFGESGIMKVVRLIIKTKETEKKIEISKAVKETLTHDKQKLEKDSTYLEKVIREKYGMIKEGEKCTLMIRR